MSADTRLGPYEIRTPLGRGGGGEVYLARDPRLERDIAIKILHAHLEGNPLRVEAFVAEARAASALNHPNIVSVFDAGTDAGRSYIVTELIDGKPLRDELNRGAVPLRRLLELGAQIADGLAAAHDAGLRHGDLKPENIVVTRAGRVKIVDFGLARPPHAPSREPGSYAPDGDESTQTVYGLAAGTIPYMSPEQARGSAATPHSDQFALGLVLYEMVSGRRAFTGDSPAAILEAILHAEPAPLPAQEARVPVQLRWIIERCLAKDPADRYAATSDLYRDLRTLRDRLGDALPPAAADSPERRRRRITGQVFAGVMLAALGAGAAVSFRTPPAPDFTPLRFVPLTSEPGYQGQPAFSPQSQAIAYAADVDGRLQIFTRKMPSGEVRQITTAAADCTHPFWSEDGQRLYYVSLAGDRQGIWTVSAAGGTRPQLVVDNAIRGALSFDGRTLAFLRDETGTGIIGGAALFLATPPALPPWTAEEVEAVATRRSLVANRAIIEGTLAFSPDDTKLGLMIVPDLSAASGWQFWIVPMTGGESYRRLEHWPEPAPRLSSFSWAPDSRHVVLGVTSVRTPGSQLWLADLEADRVWPMTRSSESQSYPTVSPDGRQAAFVSGEPDYDLYEIDLGGLTLHALRATVRNESDGVYAPDGSALAYVTDHRGRDEIWIRPRDGHDAGAPRIAQSDFGDDPTLMLASPAFSRSGALAFLRNGYSPRGVLRTWVALPGRTQPTPLLPRTADTLHGAPTFSPDGKSIAFPEWKDGAWRLVRVDMTTADRHELRADGTANAAPRWSPDGKWLSWETGDGFLVVSPDTGEERQFEDEDREAWTSSAWLAHAWTPDSQRILGVQKTSDRRLVLVEARLDVRRVRHLMELSRSVPVNNPVKGFDVSPDGSHAMTSIAKLRGHLWLIDDLHLVRPPGWVRRAGAITMKTP